MRVLLFLALIGLATSASSQPVIPSDSLCTYDLCALRIEPGWFGQEIRRGPIDNSERIGSVGLFGNDLPEVVEAIPSAYAEARASERSQWIAVGALAGSILINSYAYRFDDFDRVDDTRAIVGGLAGIGLAVTGVVFGIKAQREQSRAVWEYNRSLAPPPDL